MTQTYTHLSDEEFLREMDEKIYLSPVIKEFARRLRHFTDHTTLPADVNHRIECPVCAAGLLVEYDLGNTLFDVKVDPDA